MSSLFRKPKKNLRQRIAADSDEETEDAHNSTPVTVKVENSNSTSSSKSKTKSIEACSKDAPKKSQSSVLSFQEDLEGDEGIETFQIKKSSQSRRIARRLEKERKQKEQEQKIIIATSIEDFAAYRKDSSPTPEPELKPKEVILNGRDAEMAGYHSESDEDDGSENEGIRFRQPEPFRRALESGVIPDAALIHAARKHRQQAREMGGVADYIKVDEMPDYEKNQVSTARLVREDEHDKSDEDEGEDGRVDFSVDLQTKDKQKRREAFLAAEQEEVRELSDEAENEEDEMDRWERQQFQKAIRQRQVESAHQEMASFQQQFSAVGVSKEAGSRTSSPSMAVLDAAIKGPSARPSKVAKAPPDLANLAPLPSPEELQAKLKDRLTSLEEVHRRHVNDLERAKTDLSSCHKEVERLKKEQPRLSTRFHFFQVTRGYIHDLVDCATTKFGEIQLLEKKWTTLLGKRYRMLTERRRNDVRDEAGDCAHATQMDPTRGDNPEKVSRTAEREARRRRRRLGRKDSRHKEGLSSDDEVSDKDAMNFANEKDKIQRESSQLFADALDEFRSVEAITERFDQWRSKELDSYREAYVELFLPRILTCIIRAQFLEDAWNPLEHETTYIKKSDWFQTLVQYDLGSTDSSLLVISKTIELSVVPFVTEVIKASYDPCSTNQTNRLVTMVKMLTDEHPSLTVPNKAMQLLLSAVTEKFENAVDQDVFIPFHFAAKSPTFVNRQFWSASKLLRNILHWQNLVEDSVLSTMALDKLFRRYMLIAFKSQHVKSDPDTLDKVAYIAAAMPKQWLGPLAANAAQLQPLIEVVMSLAQNADSTTAVGKKQVQNVADVLRALGAAAEAQEVLSKYL